MRMACNIGSLGVYGGVPRENYFPVMGRRALPGPPSIHVDYPRTVGGAVLFKAILP